MADWWELLIGGGLGGGLTAAANKVLNRRHNRATDSTAEATAIHAYQTATRAAQDAIAAADDAVENARRNGDAWYKDLVAMRNETAAKVDEVRAENKAELHSLRTRNEQLTTILASMEAQITSNTIDTAEVEWAKKRNVEYEQMKAELTQLRVEVQQVPHLRAEVARLTALLEDTQREQRLDHEAMRNSLSTGGDITNG